MGIQFLGGGPKFPRHRLKTLNEAGPALEVKLYFSQSVRNVHRRSPLGVSVPRARTNLEVKGKHKKAKMRGITNLKQKQVISIYTHENGQSLSGYSLQSW